MHTKLVTVLLVLSSIGCTQRKGASVTPWGTTLQDADNDLDTLSSTASALAFSDIVSNGEMIMLTLTGSDSYFDYHGKGMGTQYLLCEKFAQKVGVSLRVEVCKDTAEMLRRLANGDGDVVAYQLPLNCKGVKYCGANVPEKKTSWAVAMASRELADSLDKWYNPQLLADIRREERYVFSAASVRRHVYAPMLNASSGQISQYDHLFKAYAPQARCDWRLLAAQCYQESTFDPRAYSWAGAQGLMQIMPSTAASLGVAESQLANPQINVEAATRYIARLNALFQDVRSASERQKFVLASYNVGHFHVRDAMALTRKNGGNQYLWKDVRGYVLKLSDATFYTDPVVKYGYMRGQETVDYVDRIYDRWETYRHKVAGAAHFNMGEGSVTNTPQKASRKNKYHI